LNNYDALFEEKLELLLKINQSERITWKGKFRPALNDQLVLPRAVNNHLNIWIAVGGTPESILRAGKHGLPVIFAIIGGNPAQHKPLFEYYRDVYKHFNHDMNKFKWVCMCMHFLVKTVSRLQMNIFPCMQRRWIEWVAAADGSPINITNTKWEEEKRAFDNRRCQRSHR
jgi:alkanesulfonate monooxygenase SsuD/methylene tetrahydromethanopterin reductase-like flavin-dependent oxidoreductase (luciferase family)